jgi:hypothetical protein
VDQRSKGRLAAGLLLAALSAGPAAAQNSVALSPPFVGADAGANISLDLRIDFADPSLGGGIVVAIDPAHLAFDSFAFDPAFPDDPALRLVCPSANPACASFSGPGILIAFAVDTFSFPAISGAHTVGELRLDVLATTSSTVSTGEDDSVAGPLVGVGGFAPPSFGSAQVIPAGTTPGVPALGRPGLVVLAMGLAVCSWLAVGRHPRGFGRAG